MVFFKHTLSAIAYACFTEGYYYEVALLVVAMLTVTRCMLFSALHVYRQDTSKLLSAPLCVIVCPIICFKGIKSLGRHQWVGTFAAVAALAAALFSPAELNSLIVSSDFASVFVSPAIASEAQAWQR